MNDYFDGAESSEARLIASLCYIFLIVVPVLVLLTELRRHRFLRFHGYQGLGAGVVLVVLYLHVIPGITWVLVHVPCIGWAFACLVPFVYLGSFGLQLYWAYLAYQGHLFSIPVLGDIARSSMQD